MASTLPDERERERGSAGQSDFLESRLGLCEVGALLLFLCSHFLNIERPWDDTMVSRLSGARAPGVEVTGGASDVV